MLVFFVKQKTAYEMRISDWSSDVCSSDLGVAVAGVLLREDFGAWDGDDAYGATLVGELCGGLDRKLHFRAGGDDHRFRCRLRLPQHIAATLCVGLLLFAARLCIEILAGQRQCFRAGGTFARRLPRDRSAEHTAEHTSELQSLMRITY